MRTLYLFTFSKVKCYQVNSKNFFFSWWSRFLQSFLPTGLDKNGYILFWNIGEFIDSWQNKHSVSNWLSTIRKITTKKQPSPPVILHLYVQMEQHLGWKDLMYFFLKKNDDKNWCIIIHLSIKQLIQDPEPWKLRIKISETSKFKTKKICQTL